MDDMRPYQGAYHLATLASKAQQPRTNYIARIYRANRWLNYDSNIQLGVLNTFLIHQAGIDAKANDRRIKMQLGRNVFYKMDGYR